MKVINYSVHSVNCLYRQEENKQRWNRLRKIDPWSCWRRLRQYPREADAKVKAGVLKGHSVVSGEEIQTQDLTIYNK